MSDPFLGEIRLVPFSFAPKGWALCAGQLLPINQNQALFSLLGTYYGATQDTKMSTAAIGRSGGGQAHDNRQPYVTLNYVIALQGIYPSQS